MLLRSRALIYAAYTRRYARSIGLHVLLTRACGGADSGWQRSSVRVIFVSLQPNIDINYFIFYIDITSNVLIVIGVM